jgi:hypothetical protein
MLGTKPVDKIIFLDIETTSQYEKYWDMPEVFQKLFAKRFAKEIDVQIADLSKDAYEEVYNQKAPLYAEWGKIICISMGVINSSDEEYKLNVTSYSDVDEVKLLQAFLKKTQTITSELNSLWSFCAHNGKNFDFPFISKRLIINHLELPKMFDFSEMKPWEIKYFIDTKEVWKFGVYDHNVSLDILAAVFDVPSSKDDMDGSQVKNVFYQDKDLKKITGYCEKDVLALASVFLKMKNIKNKLVRSASAKLVK